MLFYLIFIVFAIVFQINNDFAAFKRTKLAILCVVCVSMGKNKKSVFKKLWNLEIVLGPLSRTKDSCDQDLATNNKRQVTGNKRQGSILL